MTTKFTYIDDYESMFPEHNGTKQSVEITLPEHGIDATEMAEAFYSFMLAIGYHPDSVVRALEHVAWEHTPEEKREEDEDESPTWKCDNCGNNNFVSKDVCSCGNRFTEEQRDV